MQITKYLQGYVDRVVGNVVYVCYEPNQNMYASEGDKESVPNLF